MMKLIYNLTMHRSKRYLIKKYSKEFWKNFKANADKTFAEILPQVPDIGNSIFLSTMSLAQAILLGIKAF